MTPRDFTALLPLVVIAATAVAILLAIAVRRHHGVAAGLAIAGFLAAMASVVIAWPLTPHRISNLLVIDRYALFFAALVAGGALLTAMLAHSYLARCGGRREEFYVLLALATLGSAVLAASTHFATFFLGLELLSVSLYALIAYRRMLAPCVEAGVKYLVLAGASSAVLLFGMALIYADLGAMDFSAIAAHAGRANHTAWSLVGLALLLVGIGFKLAIVPFHLWAADVYEGAPAPVSGFIAAVSKAGAVALLVRFLNAIGPWGWGALPKALAVVAAASMFTGNLLALRQANVKRILAYSSIAHLGYLLVAVLAGARAGPGQAAAAATFYIAAYSIMILGAFGVVGALSGGMRESDVALATRAGRDTTTDLPAFRGLLWRSPALGFTLIVMLLSLAGIPLTAGFMGKFYVLAVGVGAGLTALVLILAVNSAIGLYYYLRIVITMCKPVEPSAHDPPAEDEEPSQVALTGTQTVPRVDTLTGLALSAALVLLFTLGVNPGPTIDLIRSLFAQPRW